MAKLPVDMMMLEEAFDHHGEGGWYLNLVTGDVLIRFDDPDVENEIEGNPDKYLLIEPTLPDEDHRVMLDFVAGLPDGKARRELARALNGPRSFGHFRDELRRWPDVREQWFAFRDARVTEHARRWLADHDIEPVPRPPA
ncbi:UPF0158 family protein [Opitutus sp. ER46]|uniref:UPF0158 family protein n=1 Tax=Opitutus sp. ER46 TaxID=2161864 RepID=UPI000D326C9B|nr:UPF0158 family protein [Opitutus sp. ER46]PTX91631.1 hypothetical protein DB354_17315 [Opitutus sp. ER46]